MTSLSQALVVGAFGFGLLASACDETARPAAAPASAHAAAPEPVAAAPTTKLSPHERAQRSAAALRRSVEHWRVGNQTECPTPERLATEKALSPDALTTDSWGRPFKVICDDDATMIVSFGADGREGTDDDIRDSGTTTGAAPSPATPSGAPSAAASSAPPAPGGVFDASTVVSVMQTHLPALRKTCWDKDPSGAPATASVQLTVTVAADGHVQNTSAMGDEPVGSCIAQDVKTWIFPAPGAVTTVNIPFRFVKR
jgi:hypothetical protein